MRMGIEKEILLNYASLKLIEEKLEKPRESVVLSLNGIKIPESDIKQKVDIFGGEKIKIDKGEIKIGDIVVDSCNPPVDGNLGEYNISIDYNGRCLYYGKYNYDRTNLYKLEEDGYIVITERDAEGEENRRIIEVKVKK